MSKRKNTIITGISAVMSVGAIAGIAAPLAHSSQNTTSLNNVNSNNSNTNTDVSNSGNSNNSSLNNIEYKNLNNGTIESNTLSFTAQNVGVSKNRNLGNRFNSLRTNNKEELSGFEKKTLWTESGKQKEVLISTLYDSKRKYMPILEDDVLFVGNNRTEENVKNGIYPGWGFENVIVGSDAVMKEGIQQSYLMANEILKKAYPTESQRRIVRLTIDTAMLKGNDEEAKKSVIAAIESAQPDFLVLKIDSQMSLKKIPMDLEKLYKSGKSMKKLQIYGDVTDIKELKMPKSLEEIEFYAPNLRSIDPLQIPDNANLIYDNFVSSNFTSIDLSGHKNLSKENFQKAIDIVYKTRIKERYFQNHWAGGYIAHWNLRNTGIYSFNGMDIPELNDGTGRFYIASVEIETDKGFGPSVDEVIDSTDKPSNDSQIGEWFDWNTNGWSQVTEIVVTAKDNAKIDFNKAVKEIIGFINKYPNVKKITINTLTFTDETKTQDDLVDELKKNYNPEKIESIEFIKKAKVSK